MGILDLGLRFFAVTSDNKVTWVNFCSERAREWRSRNDKLIMVVPAVEENSSYLSPED